MIGFLVVAIVGDVLPPAERARYQGYISGTFMLAALVVAIVQVFGTGARAWLLSSSPERYATLCS